MTEPGFMAVLSSSFALLLLYAVWKRVWIPTLKCHYQDRLFRLRLEILDLLKLSDNEKYQTVFSQLLDLIDAYRSNILRASFLSFMIFRRASLENPHLAGYLEKENKRIEKCLESEDEAVMRFVVRVRTEASKLLLSFMFYRNPFYSSLIPVLGLLFFLLYLPVAALGLVSRLDIGWLFNFKRVELLVSVKKL